MTRVLLTGSRDWTNRSLIQTVLSKVSAEFGLDTILVHGDCETGADAMADALWTAEGLAVEKHPADWSQGRSAGPKRNAQMVALGADLCLAFIDTCTSPRCHIVGTHYSHGATGCAALAEASGIKTLRFSERGSSHE